MVRFSPCDFFSAIKEQCRRAWIADVVHYLEQKLFLLHYEVKPNYSPDCVNFSLCQEHLLALVNFLKSYFGLHFAVQPEVALTRFFEDYCQHYYPWLSQFTVTINWNFEAQIEVKFKFDLLEFSQSFLGGDILG